LALRSPLRSASSKVQVKIPWVSPDVLSRLHAQTAPWRPLSAPAGRLLHGAVRSQLRMPLPFASGYVQR
jgi:hypothetical protein